MPKGQKKEQESNEDTDVFDLGYFEPQINRMQELDDQAQELYDQFKPVFTKTAKRAMNSITVNGAIKDLGEAANALNGIGSSSLAASSKVFDMKLNVAKLKLAQSKNDNEQDTNANAALLMRQITDTIQQNNVKDGTPRGGTQKKRKGDAVDGADLLKKRIKKEMAAGNLKINNNEKSMKHDFSKVIYRYHKRKNETVAVNMDGNIIKGYPQERIPEEQRFSRVEKGVPLGQTGLKLETYVG